MLDATGEAVDLLKASLPEGAALNQTGRRVVICEDEGVTQVQLSRLLKRAGFLVVGTANNGRTGVELEEYYLAFQEEAERQ